MVPKTIKRLLSDKSTEVLDYIKEHLYNYENQWYALNQAAIVAVTNVKGEIIYVNDTFCNISKYSKEEIIGQSHAIINSNYHDKYFFHDLWQTILNGNVWKGEVQNKAKDGSFYWVYTTIIPSISDSGKISQFISIRFDITAQKELEITLEENVQERTKELSSLNDKQHNIVTRVNRQNDYFKQFLEIMSHDLRSPVASIQGLTQIINKTTNTDRDVKSLMNQINSVTCRLGETIEELMEISSIIQEGKPKLEGVNMEESFYKAKSDLKGLILTTNAKVTCDFSQCQKISYNKSYMDSILLNLLSNAIKYRKPEVDTAIHASVICNKSSVILQVTDNGLGLDTTKFKNEFFKLRKTFHNLENSRGYGLYLIKTQIEAMGGSISINSQVGVGSTFKIHLGEKSNTGSD